MPNCMEEGWGRAGVWTINPSKPTQDRPFHATKRAITPTHPASRPAQPANSLSMGNLRNKANSQGAFKVTLGSVSTPSLAAFLKREAGIIDGGTDNAKAAGGSGVFFGSRPMWAASSDKNRRQPKAAAYQPWADRPSPARQAPISLWSAAEQQCMGQFDAEKPRQVPILQQATPDTRTPCSSRPASSGGSSASAKRRMARENNSSFEANTSPQALQNSPTMISTNSTGHRLQALLARSLSSSSSATDSFQSHCICYGESVKDKTLLSLPEQRDSSNPSHLDTMIKRQRSFGDIFAGNTHKGSRGTMLGA